MPLDYQSMLEEMSKDLSLLKPHLNLIMRTAPLRYKAFSIEKKDGSQRLVAQPAKEVKAIQRWMTANVLKDLPVHESATAYRTGSSIKLNARLHVNSNYMLKIDFERFFPSVKKRDIKLHLMKHLGTELAPDALEMIAHCLIWAPSRAPSFELCIGAPSSPLISNSILFELDSAIAEYCTLNSVAFSRYADDLTFSCSDKLILDQVLTHVRLLLPRLEYPRIRINEHKTVFASRRSRRSVTGIVLTPDHKLSVGRKRKRQIRAMYHHFLLGRLDSEQVEKLFGLMGFVEGIEPGFTDTLKNSVKINGQRGRD